MTTYHRDNEAFIKALDRARMEVLEKKVDGAFLLTFKLTENDTAIDMNAQTIFPAGGSELILITLKGWLDNHGESFKAGFVCPEAPPN